VTSASVTTEGRGVIGSIDKGLCVLIGIRDGDTIEDVEWCKKAILTTKVWPDGERQWKIDLLGSQYKLLIVSQFTLYGKIYKKGRLDFHHAMAPDSARIMYTEILNSLQAALGEDRVQQGEFGEYMQVNP
jgi:D-aminoacyl-tRNA deacylase